MAALKCAPMVLAEGLGLPEGVKLRYELVVLLTALGGPEEDDDPLSNANCTASMDNLRVGVEDEFVGRWSGGTGREKDSAYRAGLEEAAARTVEARVRASEEEEEEE